jgi:hypothetical protein
MVRHDDEVVPGDVRAESRSQADVASTRLFSRVRDALFESVRATPSTVGATPAAPEDAALVASARATLSELVSHDIGAALAEFNLQLGALLELVPDPATRYRIALAVLAKKRISEQALRQDLQSVTTQLDERLRSFSDKVEARRREQAALAARIEEEFAAEKTRSEHEIARLEAALTAERAAREKALAERDRRVGELSSTDQELTRRERAFRSAQASLLAEQQDLERELRKLFQEKP